MGLPLPDIDLYNGLLVLNTTMKKHNKTIIAAFRGEDGPVFAKGIYNHRRKAVEVTIPPKVKSGITTLSFPVRESFSGANKATMTEFINNAGHLKECISKPGTKRITWVPLMCRVYRFECQRCMTNSICPHGAIQFDASGDCYVDQDICVGQRSSTEARNVDGRWLYHRVDEETCWECMSHPACHNSIGKVLHVDIDCCGCCIQYAQLVEGMCLPDWCAYNAIGSRDLECLRCPHQVLGDSPIGYTVDQDNCEGCMICYDNIPCAKVKMKARIEGSVEFEAVINTIRYKEIRVPSSRMSRLARKYTIGFWSDRNKRAQFYEFPLEFNSRGYARIKQKFHFNDELHVAVYHKEKKDTRIPLEGEGAFFRPSIKTISPHKNEGKYSSSIKFNTIYGSFEVKYGVNYAVIK
jgi:hypothetical protein